MVKKPEVQSSEVTVPIEQLLDEKQKNLTDQFKVIQILQELIPITFVNGQAMLPHILEQLYSRMGWTPNSSS